LRLVTISLFWVSSQVDVVSHDSLLNCTIYADLALQNIEISSW